MKHFDNLIKYMIKELVYLNSWTYNQIPAGAPPKKPIMNPTVLNFLFKNQVLKIQKPKQNNHAPKGMLLCDHSSGGPSIFGFHHCANNKTLLNKNNFTNKIIFPNFTNFILFL